MPGACHSTHTNPVEILSLRPSQPLHAGRSVIHGPASYLPNPVGVALVGMPLSTVDKVTAWLTGPSQLGAGVAGDLLAAHPMPAITVDRFTRKDPLP